MKAWLRRWLLDLLGQDAVIRFIAVARVRPDDVLVVVMRGTPSQQDMENARQMVAFIWPDHRVIALDDATDLRIVREGELDEDEVTV